MKDRLLMALAAYPVFGVRDIAGVLGKSRNYAYLVAYRLKKAGVIQEIEKGKYSVELDPFVVASWITWPSYISSWAALNYYKLTEQLPFTIHVVTTRKRKRKTLTFGGAKIEFIKVKSSAFFGFERISYRGREVFVAEKEKAIIDGLVGRKISLEEAIELVQNNPKKISKRKLLSFARVFSKLRVKLGALLK